MGQSTGQQNLKTRINVQTNHHKPNHQTTLPSSAPIYKTLLENRGLNAVGAGRYSCYGAAHAGSIKTLD